MATATEGVPTTPEPTAHEPTLTANQLLASAPRTELGNAERFVVRHGADVRHVGPWNKWLVWDGRRYKVDDSGKVTQLMANTIRCIHHEALTLAAEMKDPHKRWAERSESARSMRASLSLAESMPEVAAAPDALDADPWLLNVRNGTIDLRTGERREHSKKEVLAEEFPGILAWAVRGCLEWRENGLSPPASVMTLTAAYREDQDVIGQFLAECTTPERPQHASHADGVLASEVFEAYQGWARSRNDFVMTMNAFGRRISERSVAKRRTNRGVVYELFLSLDGLRNQQRFTSSRF